MAKPRQADRVVEVAYIIALSINIIVSVSGYLMYGTNVSDEVSRDLARTPGFSPTLNRIGTLMVAINPLTKLPLALRPLCDILFTHFHLHPAIYVPGPIPAPNSAVRPSSPAPSVAHSDPGPDTTPTPEEIIHADHERRKGLIRPVIRVILAIMPIIGALIIPSFERLMSFMGSALAIVTVIIIPVWAAAKIWGWTWYGVVICVLSGIIGVVGTICAVWPRETSQEI